LEVNAIRSIEASAWNRGKPVSLLTRWAERAPFQHVSHVVAVSNEVKEYIDRLIGPSSSTVVPNGVDTAKFDPKRFDMEAVKRQLGLQGKTVLGYSGSYKAWHGLDITLDVMARLRKSNDRYHLLLIGTGECYREFGRAVDQRGLRSLVTQIPQVSHEEMPRYLAAFDYALMTYPAALRFYFSPLKMFEYLAMGIPVIATKVGQIAEVISAGEIGYLVDPPTAENFAQAVLAAEDDPLRLASIRANARKLMAAKYSWRANAEQVIGVCARVLGRER
jgi:glycosyltransferase involved in cell wall biosynthesis